jgi:hypothetical protein
MADPFDPTQIPITVAPAMPIPAPVLPPQRPDAPILTGAPAPADPVYNPGVPPPTYSPQLLPGPDPARKAAAMAVIQHLADGTWEAQQALERAEAMGKVGEMNAVANATGQMSGVLGLIAMQEASRARYKALRFGMDAGSGSSRYSNYASTAIDHANSGANSALMGMVQATQEANLARAKANAAKQAVDLRYSPEVLAANKAAALQAVLPALTGIEHADFAGGIANQNENNRAIHAAGEAGFTGALTNWNDLTKGAIQARNEKVKADNDMRAKAPDTAIKQGELGVAQQNSLNAAGELAVKQAELKNGKAKESDPSKAVDDAFKLFQLSTMAGDPSKVPGAMVDPSGQLVPSPAVPDHMAHLFGIPLGYQTGGQPGATPLQSVAIRAMNSALQTPMANQAALPPVAKSQADPSATPAQPTDMNWAEVRAAASAKIKAGHSKEEVAAALVKKGLTPQQAQNIVSTAE